MKRGFSYGATDEFGYKAVENVTTIYDLHATILHLLGLDHERLSFYHNGIERRLTDVHGHVVTQILRVRRGAMTCVVSQEQPCEEAGRMETRAVSSSRPTEAQVGDRMPEHDGELVVVQDTTPALLQALDLGRSRGVD